MSKPKSRSWYGHIRPRASDSDDSAASDADGVDDVLDLTSPSIEDANFFPPSAGANGPAAAGQLQGILKSTSARSKRDSDTFTVVARKAAKEERAKARPKSWTVHLAAAGSLTENRGKRSAFIGNPVSRVPGWMNAEPDSPRAVWASFKHETQDEQVPPSPLMSPLEYSQAGQRQRSVRWSDLSNLSYNAAHMPGPVLKRIMSYAQDRAEIAKSYMLVCQQWSRAGARALYFCPEFATMNSFHGMIRTLLSPTAFHPYPAFVRQFHIPPALSDQLMIGDIDVALQLFPNLESITLQACPSASNIVIQSLADQSPDLLHLNMMGSPISDAYLPDLFRNAPGLKSINLTGTKVTIATLVAVMDLCSNVEHVYLDGALPDSSPLTFQPLTLSSPTRPLKTLSLRNSSITDLSFRYVTSHCPELRQVILDGSSGISDDSIVSLALASSQLETLQLAFCSFVTDVSLYALAKHASHSLKRVALAGCDQISDQGVMQLVRRCSNMQELHLHGCAQILKTYIASYHTGDRRLGVECLIRGESLKLLARHRNDTVPQVVGPAGPMGKLPTALPRALGPRPGSTTPTPSVFDLSGRPMTPPLGSSQLGTPRSLTPTPGQPGQPAQQDQQSSQQPAPAPPPPKPAMVDAIVQTEPAAESSSDASDAEGGDAAKDGSKRSSRARRPAHSLRKARSGHRRKNTAEDGKSGGGGGLGGASANGKDGGDGKGNATNTETEVSESDLDDGSREAMKVIRKFAEALTSSSQARAPWMGAPPFMYGPPPPGGHMPLAQQAAMAAGGYMAAPGYEYPPHPGMMPAPGMYGAPMPVGYGPPGSGAQQGPYQQHPQQQHPQQQQQQQQQGAGGAPLRGGQWQQQDAGMSRMPRAPSATGLQQPSQLPMHSRQSSLSSASASSAGSAGAAARTSMLSSVSSGSSASGLSRLPMPNSGKPATPVPPSTPSGTRLPMPRSVTPSSGLTGGGSGGGAASGMSMVPKPASRLRSTTPTSERAAAQGISRLAIPARRMTPTPTTEPDLFPETTSTHRLGGGMYGGGQGYSGQVYQHHDQAAPTPQHQPQQRRSFLRVKPVDTLDMLTQKRADAFQRIQQKAMQSSGPASGSSLPAPPGSGSAGAASGSAAAAATSMLRPPQNGGWIRRDDF